MTHWFIRINSLLVLKSEQNKNSCICLCWLYFIILIHIFPCFINACFINPGFCRGCVIMNSGDCARQSVCYKKLFPFLITSGELVFLQLRHHSLQSSGGSAQGFLKDCLQGLVVWVGCDLMIALQVVMPFIHAGYDRKTLFRYLSIVFAVLLLLCEMRQTGAPLLVKPQLLHGQMRLQWNPVNTGTNKRKNLAVLTRVFFFFFTRKCKTAFAKRPKKVAVITRWP